MHLSKQQHSQNSHSRLNSPTQSNRTIVYQIVTYRAFTSSRARRSADRVDSSSSSRAYLLASVTRRVCQHLSSVHRVGFRARKPQPITQPITQPIKYSSLPALVSHGIRPRSQIRDDLRKSQKNTSIRPATSEYENARTAARRVR